LPRPRLIWLTFDSFDLNDNTAVELVVILERKSIFAILETSKVLSLPASVIYTHQQGPGNANLPRRNKKKGPTKQMKSEYWA
jgi:hypothetical protein